MATMALITVCIAMGILCCISLTPDNSTIVGAELGFANLTLTLIGSSTMTDAWIKYKESCVLGNEDAIDSDLLTRCTWLSYVGAFDSLATMLFLIGTILSFCYVNRQSWSCVALATASVNLGMVL